jgi:hypothetical protein
VLAVALLSAAPLGAPLWAQSSGTVARSTEFLLEPGGAVLASIPAGTELKLAGKTRGEWTEASLGGWIFTPSTDHSSRKGFDLVVTPKDGENLRVAPNKDVVARLRTGMLLERIGSRGKWSEVRRLGWIPTSALSAAPGGAVAKAPAAKPSTAKRPAAKRPPSTAAPAGDAAGYAPSDTPADNAPDSLAADRIEVAHGTQLFVTPGSTAVGALQPGLSGRVLARSGDWVRVQLEGWVRAADLQNSTAGVLRGVTAEEIRADPGRFVGKTVEWQVQLIAVQTADELRPEMPSGQPYLLTRGPLPESGFVYVMIDPAQADRFRALAPLQGLTIRAVVRASRTKYLETPVVELLRADPTPAP